MSGGEGLRRRGDVALIPSPTGTATGFGGDRRARSLGRGNREGEGTVERGGPGRLGLGSAQLGQGPVGGGGFLLCFFLFVSSVAFSFLFIYFLFCFTSF